MFSLTMKALFVFSTVGLGNGVPTEAPTPELFVPTEAPTPERRRGYGAFFCWGVCTGACAMGTGGIGFPTPVGWACETVCVAACTASTACFDENALIRVWDEASGSMLTKKISEFADKTTDAEVQTAGFLGDGTHLKAATETLEAVVAIEGNWEFYEITVTTGPILSTRRNTLALNTTDDHGWIVVDSDGSDGCVVHAAEVQVGDFVLVFPEGSFSPVVAKVTYTRSFWLPTKYAAYTDSGLLVANGVLTTVFCDHDSNDCAANLTLKERLDVWKQRHAKQISDAKKMFPVQGDGRVTPEKESSDAYLREEIDELKQKVNKVQMSLKRFKRKVAAQLDN